MSIGRTPLIKLSPKKTVEGFVGAFISTVLFSLLWGSYFMRFNYMICPVHDLGVSAWSNVQCVPNPVFVWKDWQIPTPLATVLSTTVCSRLSSIRSGANGIFKSFKSKSLQFHMCLTIFIFCQCRFLPRS